MCFLRSHSNGSRLVPRAVVAVSMRTPSTRNVRVFAFGAYHSTSMPVPLVSFRHLARLGQPEVLDARMRRLTSRRGSWWTVVAAARHRHAVRAGDGARREGAVRLDTLQRCAPVWIAPVRSASVRFVVNMNARVRSASFRFAPVKSVPPSIAPDEVGAGQIGAPHVGPGEVRTAEIDAAELGVDEADVAEVLVLAVGPLACTGQVPASSFESTRRARRGQDHHDEDDGQAARPMHRPTVPTQFRVKRSRTRQRSSARNGGTKTGGSAGSGRRF